MYEIENTISAGSYKGLTVEKLTSDDNCEALLIMLEKASHFPEHTSPRNVLLVMLEGVILFTISNKNYTLQKHQTFKFPAGEKHKVVAMKNAKFLIIR